MIFPLVHSMLAEVDPRGPIATFSAPKVSPGRVEAGPFAFRPGDIPSRPGRASWIWLDPNRFPGNPPVAAEFRKEIDLPETPLVAQSWFSADAHTRIYVNGHLAARGPDDGGQDYPGTQTGRWFVNYRNLTPYFHKGKNVVSAEVFTERAMEGRYNTTHKGGFLFEANFKMRHGKVSLSTDESWHGIPGKEWRFAKWSKDDEALEFDGRAEEVGWRSSDFDASHWPTCKIPTTAWPSFAPSEIPPRLEATYPIRDIERATANVSVEGHRIDFRGDGSCAVRYDRVLSGFIGLKLRGKAGTLLAIQASEPNTPGYNRMATVLLRDGEQTLELPFYDGFSTINLVASGVKAPLSILDLRANFVAQPVNYQGSFSCSDEKLNRIWDAARWATELCQQTHHLDSPDHQEPICDPGDYLIISLNNFCAFGQPYLARQDLRKYAWLLRATKFHPFHTSYALLWLQMLMNYLDYTGDTSLVRELAPEVHDLLDQFARYRGKNGLISEAPDYMFMDWVTIGGFGAHHPPAVIGQGYMTAFFYRGLADGIRVASLEGDTARVGKYQAMRQEIQTAYNRELWDEGAGLYRDGRPFVTSVKPGDWLPADVNIETHSTQNNVLAVLYDLAATARQAPILRRLLQGDLNTQPYYMHFVLNAIDHAGLFNEVGASQMRRWKIVPDTQSFREMWDSGDYSHAWGCTPLFQMSSHVLGITPTSPGFKTISIRPEPCDLTWAQGAMPTPKGKVEVAWRRSSTEFRVRAKIPPCSSAELEMPSLGAATELTVDGVRVSTSKAARISSGIHEAVLRTKP